MLHMNLDDLDGGRKPKTPPHGTLTEETGKAIWAAIDADKALSVKQMATERDAIRVMHRALERLKALGWRDAIYCPKDGTMFEVIEPGSTGIHHCIYRGEWPKGGWWILEKGDMWPSRPVLFRNLSQPTNP